MAVSVQETLDKSRQKIIGPFSILPSLPSPLCITSVSKQGTYDYYGALSPHEPLLDASKFVAQHTDAEVLEVERTLDAFLDLTQEDYCQTKGVVDRSGPLAAWFTMRITTPTLEYTMPRWHRDGSMYDPDHEGDINSKYAMALLGNPTRVLAESELVSEVVKLRVNGEVKREEYAGRLASQPLVDIEKGQIIRFGWGQDDSPVHSEPDMNSDRVFISILYGSEGELRSMCEIRNEVYRE